MQNKTDSTTYVKEFDNLSERDPLPETFTSIEEMAEFWDTHSIVDYEDAFEDVTEEVIIDIKRSRSGQVSVEATLLDQISEVATKRGVALETLVNLWLQKQLMQAVSGN